MTNDVPARHASSGIAIAAVLVLVVGLVAWFSNWRPLQGGAESSRDTVAVELDDQVVERALRQIPGYVDSTAIKSQWVDEVDGVDIGALGNDQRDIFVRAANSRRCTCGCGYTLAACRRFDTTCPVSLGFVEALRDSVVSGAIASAAGLRERPAIP